MFVCSSICTISVSVHLSTCPLSVFASVHKSVCLLRLCLFCPSVKLSICLSICLFGLSVRLMVSFHIYPSVSVFLSTQMFVCSSIKRVCSSVYLSIVCLCVCPFVCLSSQRFAFRECSLHYLLILSRLDMSDIYKRSSFFDKRQQLHKRKSYFNFQMW
jgi:hypothetical protein